MPARPAKRFRLLAALRRAQGLERPGGAASGQRGSIAVLMPEKGQ